MSDDDLLDGGERPGEPEPDEPKDLSREHHYCRRKRQSWEAERYAWVVQMAARLRVVGKTTANDRRA